MRSTTSVESAVTAGAHFSLLADPAALREARRRVGLLDGLPRSVVADAQLVISEVVTNALLHAGLRPDDRIDVGLRIDGAQLVIDVDDHGRFSRATHAAPRRPDGVGLRVLDTLCVHWQAHDGRVVARVALYT